MAAATLAAGTHAYGDIIYFENDSNFSWGFNTLDITKPSNQQDSAIGTPTALYMGYFSDSYGGYGYGSFDYATTYLAGGGAELWSDGFADRYAAPLSDGTMIGPGLADGQFSDSSIIEFSWYSCDQYYNCDSGERGILPDGVRTYLGVRFDAGIGNQYGWIVVERQGVFLEVFGWAYETEAGVAIPAGHIPAPGTLAALAFGAAAGSRGRRNRRRHD